MLAVVAAILFALAGLLELLGIHREMLIMLLAFFGAALLCLHVAFLGPFYPWRR